MSRIRAIIFDLDGTLVESQTAWRFAEDKLFERCGHHYDPEIARLYQGMNARDVARVIHRELSPLGLSVEESAAFLRQHLIEASQQGTTVKIPGADEIIDLVRGNYQLAIASGSPHELIMSLLEDFGWGDIFRVAVSSEEVEKGKPEPDVFWEAARRLVEKPARTLVIEDSAHGLIAAKKAGMSSIAVGEKDFDEKATIADRAFKSLAQIELSMIEEL